MLHVGEFFDDHEPVCAGGGGVADAVDVVAGKVHEHDVFGSVFEAGAEFVGEGFVFFGGPATFDGAGDGVGDYAAGGRFGFYEEFGGGANEVEIGAGDVEEIGRGVHGAQMAVDVERVQGCGA